ncbi:phage tail protein [Lacrimispora sp. AGF001]|uniref:phage tail protein n=1 Tax=Lacrimispora sp. AGF001 TaxID=3401631 RepID=UPI003B4369B9
MNITISVPEETIKEMVKRLDEVKRKPKSVIKAAVNNTSKKAQSLLAQKASKVYAGKVAQKGSVISASEIQKASAETLSAIIKFRSPVHEIKEFHVSSLSLSKTSYKKNGKRGGRKIKGNVLKGSSKPLDAFVVQFKNGHISVVSRVPGSKMKSNPKKEKIRKLLSPSYPVMIKNEKVYGETSDEIASILSEQVAKVMDKVLGGK